MIFLSGGIRETYRNSHQQCGALHLAHVRDGHSGLPARRRRFVRAEAAHDLPAGADDAHGSVIAAEEEAVGARADGRDVIALKEGASAALVGVGDLDLGCIEEVEGPPLYSVTRNS